MISAFEENFNKLLLTGEEDDPNYKYKLLVCGTYGAETCEVVSSSGKVTVAELL